MLELLKYLRGYLRICVSGFSPERFMNLCSNKGILLWDIVRKGDDYYMNINLRGFRLLRPIVKKTGTKVAILERYGLPFFLPKLLKRKVFVAGLFVTVAFWIGSSFFIWDIEITGNYQITEDMFYSFLQESQVNIGMKKDSLDIEALEKEIRKEFPQITWASARLNGTKLLIDIKENDAPIFVDTKKETAGTDLVSEYEGTIVDMIVRSGVPKVSIGDTVEQGTVLVEGRVPIYNEDTTLREYFYVDADADIVLEHTRSYTARLLFDYIQKEYTGREKEHHYLRVGQKELALPQNRPFLVYDSVIRESRPLLFEKLSIPIFIGSYTHREYMNVEYEYSLEQVRTILNQKLVLFLKSLEEKGVQIIEKDVKIDTENDEWVLEGTFVVQEQIGVSTEIVRSDGEEVGEVNEDE